jgi:hypothetical protein
MTEYGLLRRFAPRNDASNPQQWLLRGDSSPPFKIGGPGCGEGGAGERKSFAGSRSGRVRWSLCFSPAISILLHLLRYNILLQDNIFKPCQFRTPFLDVRPDR